MDLLIHACDISNPTKPFEIYSIWAKNVMNEFYLLKKLMHDYWYIFAFVLIAFGAFLCFYGHKIIWLTIILVMGIVLCIFVSLIILNFIPSLIDTEKKLWILLASGFGAGVIIGLFIKNQVKYNA